MLVVVLYEYNLDASVVHVHLHVATGSCNVMQCFTTGRVAF